MVLSWIWVFFFFFGFLAALYQLFFHGNCEIFPEMMQASFAMSRTAFEIALGLTGIMTFWMGLMAIGEKSGAICLLAKLVAPLVRRLFPEIPPDHPVLGTIVMNYSANMLGLDNAATPVGLKAMQQLQDLNPDKERASNAQIMFLVLNTSGLTLLPVTVLALRAQMGAANPADIFLPILIATFCSSLVGLLAVGLKQKINFRQPALWLPIGIACTVLGLILLVMARLPQDQLQLLSSFVANGLLLLFILFFLGLGVSARLNLFETFVEGAREGFPIIIRIVPYIVGILVAVALFRASGAMDLLLRPFYWMLEAQNLPSGLADALPSGILRPLTGSGSRALMIETMKMHGVDSFAARLAGIFQGSTDTTFYILAVYFGSVGIKNPRYALPCGLIADAAGLCASVVIALIFFA